MGIDFVDGGMESDEEGARRDDNPVGGGASAGGDNDGGASDGGANDELDLCAESNDGNKAGLSSCKMPLSSVNVSVSSSSSELMNGCD